MYYYKFNNRVLASIYEYEEFERIDEASAKACCGIIIMLNKMDPLNSRRCFSINHPSLSLLNSEGLELLKKSRAIPDALPKWLLERINEGRAMSVNTSYPNFMDAIEYSLPEKWNINIIGLGDVGGTLAAGLRLLGGNLISSIGLYDRDANKTKRWFLECSQIMAPNIDASPDFEAPENILKGLPDVKIIDENGLFDCHMFVFCVSSGVPPVDCGIKDVRMAQLEGNAKIVNAYARMARERHFKGIFAVVSDPVDLLCKSVFLESNKDQWGNMDFMGLGSDQIRGYGLGVMNARAAFYAKQRHETIHYLSEGRAFGPHGEGLIIADSVSNYNHELSLYLTEKARTANMEVRSSGFKPYIAPALSSGSLSILSTIKGSWHYSATYMGGVYMGSCNRLTPRGTELEALDFPDKLWNRLKNTYESLRVML